MSLSLNCSQYSLLSHWSPFQPIAQAQLYFPFASSMQVPPLKHGLESQATKRSKDTSDQGFLKPMVSLNKFENSKKYIVSSHRLGRLSVSQISCKIFFALAVKYGYSAMILHFGSVDQVAFNSERYRDLNCLWSTLTLFSYNQMYCNFNSLS